MFKVKMFLCACLCVVVVLLAPARGNSILVKNVNWEYTKHGRIHAKATLSDLILYGDPNDPDPDTGNRKEKVILKPNDSSDDIVVEPSGMKTFHVNFEITEFEISHLYKDSERPADWGHTCFVGEIIVPKKVPKKVGFIRDPDEQQKVVLEVDQAVAPEPPPVGTILAFVDGYNKLMTGWFVGTDINFDTGEVTGPYTGNVEVFAIPFEVMVFTPPYPPDGAENIPLNAKLYWSESEEADWYDVYFGTRSLPTYMGDRTAIDYEPYTLEPCTMYYWKVKQVIEHIEEWPDEPEPPDEPDPNEPPDEPDPNEPPDEPKPPKPPPWPPDPNEPPIEMLSIATELVWYEIIEGPTWSFTTGPANATNPHPIHCATDVDPNAILSWTPGCFAAFEDVYLGTDFGAVANADTSDTTGIYRGRRDANSYDPGGLEVCRTYFWRIEGGNDVPPDTPDDPWNGDIWSFMTVSGPVEATKPSPADGATDVDPNAILSWTPGCFAAFNDVYFGTDFDAVDNADTSDTTGIYRGRQDANSYTPPETLEFGQVYFWRVDGVNNLHADSPWKGDLWSFTPPDDPNWLGYRGFYATGLEDPNDPNWNKLYLDKIKMPGLNNDWNIADSNNQIKVTLKKEECIWFSFINWHDADKKKYFQFTLTGNAVSDLDLEEATGFEGSKDKKVVPALRCGKPRYGRDKGKVCRRFRYRFGPPQPMWERFKFKAKKEISGKTITIRAWSICGTAEFRDAGRWPDWPEVNSFGIGGPGAESGILGVTNIENYALSILDASFLSQSPGAVIGVPRITDIYVFPNSATVNTLVPPNFSADPSTGNWTASFVYTDPNGDSRPQGGVRFASDGPGLGTSDRFNLQVFLAGQIDSTYELYAYDQDSGQYMDFGIVVDTLDCIDVVDDFEDYGSDISNRIFETWIDGLGYTDPPPGHPGNGTGAIVGNSEAPVAEQTIVYEGGQSMPFRYDNSGSYRKAFYSETERTFGAPQDWTKDGVEVLTLRFFGDPNNVAEPMYLAVEDSIGHTAVVYHDDPNAVLIDDWTEWNIDLKDFADQGVNLADVSSIAIGVGDRYNPIPGGSGTIYFDDIRLCRPIDVAGEGSPLAADINSDSLVDMADLWVMAEEWLNLRQ